MPDIPPYDLPNLPPPPASVGLSYWVLPAVSVLLLAVGFVLGITFSH